VGSAYNTGGLRKVVEDSAWYVSAAQEYVVRAAPVWNAAATFFNGPPAPEPVATTRFKR